MKLTRAKRQARMVDQSSTMLNLPLHILIEIISRLPIKSVMAISCVSKSLLSLVSDSHFQMLHSTRAPTELFYSVNGVSSKILCLAEYVFEDHSLTDVDTESTVVFELPSFSVLSENYCDFGADETRVDFVNSCCGLVCFKGPRGDNFAVVCNPFTREFITFPCPSRADKTIGRVGYGLGFSPKDNNFKLLRMMYRNNVDSCVVEIYTFGERGSSWKRVDDRCCVCVSGLEKIVFHEGVLHWDCVSRNAVHPHHAVVTFDFDTERFGELVIPICTSGMCESEVRWSSGDQRREKKRWSSAVGVFENCLCISGCVGDFVDVWALKEYGSWIKIFSIRKDAADTSRGSYEPFKYLQNGDVLMFKDFGGSVLCFTPETGSVKKVDEMCSRSRNGAIFIRPSLVSLTVLLGGNAKVHCDKHWDKDEVESFSSEDPRPSKDRRAGQSSSEIHKLAGKIETVKAEEKRKGKAMAKSKKRLEKGKKKDCAFMRFMYQQMLNANPSMPACPISDDSSSSDDSE